MALAADSVQPAAASGQRPGIYVLFLVEMWERFSYYGMRALLIFYLTQRLQVADDAAATVYSSYTALVYGAAIAGAAVADRILGQWRSIVAGGWLIMIGHLGLALEGMQSVRPGALPPLFLVSLGLIIAGTGLFKPSSTALVGGLYRSDEDAARQTGYYIFYLGINLGSFLAALVAGYLGQALGWQYGFGAAALGMASGLLTLRLGRRHLEPYAAQASGPATARGWALVVLLPLGAIALMATPAMIGVVLAASLVAGVVLVGRAVRRDVAPGAQARMRSILAILVIATLFWSLFEQAGSSIALFTSRAVDLSVGPVTLQAAQTQFFNPAFILLLTPAFALLWMHLAKRGREPSTPLKLALAVLQVGLGFGVLALGAWITPAGQGISLAWLALAYLLHTTGELCLSPTAMSSLSKIAPPSLSSMVMGLWLFSLAAGNFLGGSVARWIVRSVPDGQGAGALGTYAQVFATVALSAAVVAAAILGVTPWMRRQLEALR